MESLRYITLITGDMIINMKKSFKLLQCNYKLVILSICRHVNVCLFGLPVFYPVFFFNYLNVISLLL